MPEAATRHRNETMRQGEEAFLREEIRELGQMKKLLQEERESVRRMDPERLLQASGARKESAERLHALASARSRLDRTPTGTDPAGPERWKRVGRLLETREKLLAELRERNRAHADLLASQSEHVGQMLAFLRQVRAPSLVYDQNGKMRRE